MRPGLLGFYVLLLAVGSRGSSTLDFFSQNDAVSSQTAAAYNIGLRMGIINPEKYSLESFEQDERYIFKDLYTEYISLNGSHPINYQEWLVMNNFGILPDTQESLFQRKINTRSKSDNKKRFVNTVRKGDILITGLSRRGLTGYSAIMSTDYWVLEMPGGYQWRYGIEDNNRQIPKNEWFDLHASDWTTVYRCPDSTVANEAAIWADHTYFNPAGGSKKTRHITYQITPDFKKVNPSYCSKLVLQAYFYGSSTQVVSYSAEEPHVIVPINIPAYFMEPYKLINKGKF